MSELQQRQAEWNLLSTNILAAVTARRAKQTGITLAVAPDFEWIVRLPSDDVVALSNEIAGVAREIEAQLPKFQMVNTSMLYGQAIRKVRNKLTVYRTILGLYETLNTFPGQNCPANTLQDTKPGAQA